MGWPCFKLRLCRVRATASSLRVITKENKYAGKTNSNSITSSHQKGQGCGGQNKTKQNNWNQGVQGVRCEGVASLCELTSLASWITFTKWTVRVTDCRIFFLLEKYVYMLQNWGAHLGWCETHNSLLSNQSHMTVEFPQGGGMALDTAEKQTTSSHYW